MKFKPDAVIAHMDFDGMIGGILLKKCFKVPVYYVGYKSLDSKYEEVLGKYKNVVITDISLKPEQYERHADRFEDGSVVLIDHHETTKPIVGKPGVVFDEKEAGSSLTYIWLLKNYPEYLDILRPYVDFAVLSKDYDLWHLKDENSSIWNAYISKIGFYNAESRIIINPSINFTKDEEKIVADLIQARQETRTRIRDGLRFVQDKDETHVLGIYSGSMGDPFAGEEIALAMEQLPYDLTLIIWDPKRCSLRAKEMNILETHWKDMFGGHKKACGMLPDKANVEMVLDRIGEKYKV